MSVMISVILSVQERQAWGAAEQAHPAHKETEAHDDYQNKTKSGLGLETGSYYLPRLALNSGSSCFTFPKGRVLRQKLQTSNDPGFHMSNPLKYEQLPLMSLPYFVKH